MAAPLPPDLRSSIDSHLDAIDRVLLTAGLPREQRRNITDNVETQILDMLAQRTATPTGDRPATLDDIAAILSQLDPPAAYAESASTTASTSPVPAGPPPVLPSLGASTPSAPPAPPRPRLARAAIWGAILIALSILPMLCVLPLGFFWGKASAVPPRYTVTTIQPPETITIQTPGSQPRHITDLTPLPPGLTTSATAPALVPSAPTSMAPVEGPTYHYQSSFSAGPAPSYRKSAFSLCFLFPFAACALAGTLLGWIALFQIRASKGRLTGTALALFDGLFYPVLGLFALFLFLSLA